MYTDTASKHFTTLFSETDKYGTITFVNEAFCEIAKYTREELIGKPHNIVRHPDMPKKLFELCWTTIKSGKVFKAVIKNRAKDQTHYWVQATIMPILDNNDEILRYISVRHLIENETQANDLYAQQVNSFGLIGD